MVECALQISENWVSVCLYLSSPPAVINSKILTVTVRPEPQPSEPMVVVELSPLLNVRIPPHTHLPPSLPSAMGTTLFYVCVFFPTAQHSWWVKNCSCWVIVCYWSLNMLQNFTVWIISHLRMGIITVSFSPHLNFLHHCRFIQSSLQPPEKSFCFPINIKDLHATKC